MDPSKAFNSRSSDTAIHLPQSLDSFATCQLHSFEGGWGGEPADNSTNCSPYLSEFAPQVARLDRVLDTLPTT